MRIDHIGIAVENLDEALKLYRRILKVKREKIAEAPAEKIRTALLWLEEGIIEVMEPQGDEGPVAQFLRKRGAGLHHIAVTVPSLDDALREAASEGFTIVPPAPRRGVLGNRVAFIHPKSLNGVLLELCERKQTA